MRLLVCILAVVVFTAKADYLITSRSGNIKAEADRNSETIENIPTNTRLTLLDNGAQVNEYYHVSSLSGAEGWIYRTLVRRYTDPTTSSSTTGPISTSSNDVEVVAIDVGAGLSCLIKVPGNRYIIYDGGRSMAYNYLKTRLAAGTEIEALILSHTDADHWGAAEQIISNYKVKKVIRTDYRANAYSQTYLDAVAAIENASYPLEDVNLGDEGDLQPGQILYNKDGVKLVALCGFSKPPAAWGPLDVSKANNAVSIVVRLEYKNHSIILAGDAVGKEDCDESNACIATEKFMLDNVAPNLLNADVLIAAHHGADNASCDLFIDRVSPGYVVFSAGHSHRHPRQATVERFINWGVNADNIFRTDRGDFEDSDDTYCKMEWSDENSGAGDITGDDHVRMILPASGRIRIGYLTN